MKVVLKWYEGSNGESCRIFTLHRQVGTKVGTCLCNVKDYPGMARFIIVRGKEDDNIKMLKLD